MQITLLGPLAVDGRPVRGERLGAVVRELIEARGRVVSVGAIVDAVWGGAPPDDATGAVQALVSRVRRLGLPVRGASGGYRVPTDEVSVDAVVARSLVERARRALTAGEVVAAAGLGDEARALFPEVPDLTEPGRTLLFADVTAVRVEAALAGGIVGSAVGATDLARTEDDLRRLVAGIPPHEPAAVLLVRALAAQGREAEALETIDRLRVELAQRYGTDVSPAVARVRVALLRQELAAPSTQAPSTALAATDRSTAPPPATASVASPAGWRRPTTPLVGREADVVAVTTWLAEAPLVTVVATGGAGKTRLAAEVARRAALTGRSVYVVELAGVRSPDEVTAAVLAAIGTSDTGPEWRVAAVRDRVRAAAQDLDGLLVLDNCEHVLDAAASVVADILDAATPGLALLATSRAPLGLAGESVYRLRALPDADALALLRSRAEAGGAVASHDRARLLELCHRLDNLPLALELAAARLRHMPIEDVLAGLADRFALLDDALRGLPERHASLWAMVDWSRALLTPADQRLLERLSVIPAPFTGDLASAVAGQPDVRRGLATLVEQSLLHLESGIDRQPLPGDRDSPADPAAAGAPVRYRMLETVREYGEIRLGSGRGEAMAGLVGWARALSIAIGADFIGPGQVAAIGRCAADQETLLSGLRWALAQYDEPASTDIAAALFYLWSVRGRHNEVVNLARTYLSLDDPAARTRSTIARGSAAGTVDGVAAADRLPNADRLAWTLLVVSVNSGVIGVGPSRLDALVRRAMAVLRAERAEQLSERTRALTEAESTLAARDPEVAMRSAEDLIGHTDPWVAGFGHFARSVLRENEGLADGSAADALAAYQHFQTAGDHWVMGLAAQGIAQRLTARADLGAETWLRRSEQHLELVGATEDAQSVRVLLDVQLALAGDGEAEARLHEALESPQFAGMDHAQAQLGLAELDQRTGRVDDALARADAVARIASGNAPPFPQVRIVSLASAASIYLRLAARPDSPIAAADADARATALIAAARDEVVALLDVPVLGSWAVAGAELAVHRGQDEVARELWTLANRLGANLVFQFQSGYGESLAALVADDEVREAWIKSWATRPVAEATGRVRELVDALLG